MSRRFSELTDSDPKSRHGRRIKIGQEHNRFFDRRQSGPLSPLTLIRSRRTRTTEGVRHARRMVSRRTAFSGVPDRIISTSVVRAIHLDYKSIQSKKCECVLGARNRHLSSIISQRPHLARGQSRAASRHFLRLRARKNGQPRSGCGAASTTHRNFAGQIRAIFGSSRSLTRRIWAARAT